MSAWPMMKRCLLAQWRGLSGEQRDKIDRLWEMASSAGELGNVGHSYDSFHAILWWTVVDDRVQLILMGVK